MHNNHESCTCIIKEIVYTKVSILHAGEDLSLNPQLQLRAENTCGGTWREKREGERGDSQVGNTVIKTFNCPQALSHALLEKRYAGTHCLCIFGSPRNNLHA